MGEDLVELRCACRNDLILPIPSVVSATAAGNPETVSASYRAVDYRCESANGCIFSLRTHDPGGSAGA